jgi:hypothetical protein
MREQAPIDRVPFAPDATIGVASDLTDRMPGPQRAHPESGDDTLDRLAIWLAEVSADAALAGNGDR